MIPPKDATRMSLPLIAAIACGLLLSAQPLMNGALARAIQSPGSAAMVSLLVSAILLVPFALRGGGPVLADLARVPWWAWAGGTAGAAFVGGGILLAPMIGLALFLSLVVAGQLLGALSIEALGLFGAARIPIHWTRIAGVGLVLAGALLVRFGKT